MWSWPEASSVPQTMTNIPLRRTVHLHQGFQRVHGRIIFRTMVIFAAQSIGIEVSTGLQIGRNFRAERLDTEIISPDLTVLCVLQDFCLER